MIYYVRLITLHVGCQTTDPNAATTPTTTSTGSDTTSTYVVDQTPQGDNNNNIIYIAIGIPVGAVVIVTTAALLLIILWKCKRTTKVEPPGENVYTKSPSLQPDSPPVYSPYATTESYSRMSSTQSSGSDQSLLPAAGAKSGIQVSTGVGVVAVSLQSSTTSYARSGVSVIVLDQLIAGYLHYWY